MYRSRIQRSANAEKRTSVGALRLRFRVLYLQVVSVNGLILVEIANIIYGWLRFSKVFADAEIAPQLPERK